MRFGLASLAFVLLPLTPAWAVEVDPLLPPDAQLVACLHVRQFLDAPAVKTHLRDRLAPYFPANLLKDAGIDPLRDIDRITLAGPAAAENDKLLLILRGRFQPEKIDSTLAEVAKRDADTLRIESQGERRLFHARTAERGPLVFCVLDREVLLLAANKAPILDAIARKDGKKPGSASRELQALLGKIDEKATAWLAVLITPELKKILTPTPEYQRVVDSLRSAHGSLTVDEGLRADFVIQTGDARAAVEIRKFTEGIKSILILAAANQDKKNGALWADLLSSLKIANQGDAVTVKGQVTAEQLEKSIQNSRKAQP
jgi:hypothetical protein